MPPTAGSSTGNDQPRFYYDLASPEAYLVAERALHALGEVPEWIPVRIDEPGPFRCQEEVNSYMEDVERRAAALGLMALRWPDPFPADTEWAMLAATYAKQIGRGVAFSLAANTERARADGVRTLPAVWVGGRILEGERAIPA